MRQPAPLSALLAAFLYLCLPGSVVSALGQLNLTEGERLALQRGDGLAITQGPKLQLGVPVERKLGPREAHIYDITVDEKQFVQVVVEQRGIDVIVRVASPTGKSLGDFDSPNGNQGPEDVSFVAVQAGTYRVTVSPLDERDKTSGQYQIKIVEVRDATEQELKSSANLEVIKAKGLALMTEVDALIKEMRLPQTRARSQLQAARVLWSFDEKRSSKFLSEAADSLKEIIASADFSDPAYMRNLSLIGQLRYEIAQLWATRDPEAALNFVYSSKLPKNPYGNEREQMVYDSGLELSIANQLVESNPKRTIEIARQSLKKGYPTDLIYTIDRLRQKNPELATELASEVATKLASEQLLKKQDAALLAGSILRTCLNSETAPKKPGLNEVRIEQILSLPMCRELLQNSTREVLSYTPPGPNVYSPERDSAWNLLNALLVFGPELDSIVANASASIQKKLAEMNPRTATNEDFQKVQAVVNEAPLGQGAIQAIERLPAELQEGLYTQVAISAAAAGESDRARQLLNEHVSNSFQRQQAMNNIALQEVSYFMSQGRIEDALRTISAARTPRERAILLNNNVARQIGQGRKRPVALNLLDQARSLLAPGIKAQDQQQMRALLELSRAYSRYDWKRAFEIVDPLVDQLNEMCSAARTLEGFGQEYYNDEELDLQNGTGVAMSAIQLTDTLGGLAFIDFERAKATADRLSLPELRLLAYLDIAQQTIRGR